jgi:hypothetical protein
MNLLAWVDMVWLSSSHEIFDSAMLVLIRIVPGNVYEVSYLDLLH